MASWKRSLSTATLVAPLHLPQAQRQHRQQQHGHGHGGGGAMHPALGSTLRAVRILMRSPLFKKLTITMMITGGRAVCTCVRAKACRTLLRSGTAYPQWCKQAGLSSTM